MKKLFATAFAVLLVFVLSGLFAGGAGESALENENGVTLPGDIEQKKLDEEEMEDQSVRVILNGREVEFEIPPLYCEEQVKVPARPLLEKIGAQVRWEGETRSVVVELEETVVYFRMRDELIIEIDDEVLETEYPPSIVNGVTMLPLELITELYDFELSWEEAGKVARLESAGFIPSIRLDEIEDETEREQLKKWAEGKRLEMGAQARIVEDRLYLLVTFGEKPTGGYRVDIRKMEQIPPDAFKVTVLFQEPSPEHITIPAISYPYDLVAIDLFEIEEPSFLILYIRGLDEFRREQIPVKLEPVKAVF